MHYRWFRSPLLWIGLFGLVFLLWAWRDSARAMSHASYGSKPVKLTLMSVASAVDLRFSTKQGSYAAHLSFDHWEFPRGWDPSTMRDVRPWNAGNWFPAPWFGPVGDEKVPGFGRILVLPYWLLVPVYLVGWGGLMGWRRRKRKLIMS